MNYTLIKKEKIHFFTKGLGQQKIRKKEFENTTKLLASIQAKAIVKS